MALSAKQFTFKAVLSKKDASGAYVLYDGNDNDTAADFVTGNNDQHGLVVFGSYEFTEPGEYRWDITENQGESPEGGTMTYDASVYKMYVTVADNAATGKLSVSSVEMENGKAPVFTNVFVPTPKPGKLDVVLRPEGSKILQGRALRDGEFTFSVYDMQGVKVAAGSNDVDGNIIFDYDLTAEETQNSKSQGILFANVGTYYYTVTEDVPEEKVASVTYDPAVWTVRFEVTQDRVTGALLVADPEITEVTGSTASKEKGIVFTNIYNPKPAEVVLTGNKSLTGREMIAGEFEFHLLNDTGNVVARGYNDANGVITFSKLFLPVGAETPMEYTVVEVEKSAIGVTYDDTVIPVQISVADDPENGTLVPSVTVNGAAYDASKTGEMAQIAFANTYHGLPVEVTVEARKILKGRDLAEEEFVFKLEAPDDNPADVELTSGTNDAEGNVALNIRISEAGRYTFLVKEVAGSDENVIYSDETWNVFVDVTDPGTGYLQAEVRYENGEIPVFTNTYIPSTVAVQLEGLKTLTGREMTVGEFTFVVKDSRGVTVATGTNGVGGKILFQEFEMREGKGQKLYISEMQTGAQYVTFDKQVFCVTVDVNKDVENAALVPVVHYPEGGIVFQNTYKVPEEPEENEPQPATPLPETPTTGDSASVSMWLTLLTVSVAGFVVLLTGKRKKFHK